MKILLAEDDPRLGNLIGHMLKREGHEVDWVQRGDDAYDYAKTIHYDLLILDWMMPAVDGVSLCQRLRQEGQGGPILMLTAKDAVEDRVQGLDAGADDYLVKPFAFVELSARLRALSRRGHIPLQEEVVQVADLMLNRSRRSVTRNGDEIQLTTREYHLFDLLVQNRGQVLPRELIMERVWGYDSEVTDNTLDAYIRLLRKKIESPETRKLIHNIRGVGYTLEE
ncbi:response regulator [Heliobacillus mobilis]|uniref:Stage 0 sporulation protein A homolog n=1 Tax=Heliobacterium mobile TaxID=28064 RepID=A0A6I3SKQ5_HELMO|nr:response regulator transcription factor [Heliobacterium mobile]MTV49097.1 response regulator [Heliobacterium mobile]